MGFKHRVKTTAADIRDYWAIRRKRYYVMKKFRSPKRVSIYSQVQLTGEQEKQIDDLFLSNYGEKVPYIWHRHFTAFTGNFDVNYFPELLYNPEFERFMNPNPTYCKVLADKNMTPLVARAVGIETPPLYLSSTAGVLRDADYRQVSREDAARMLRDIGDCFCKPSVDSSSGRSCRTLHLKDGHDTESGKPIGEILDGLGPNFLIQQRLKCHSSIAAIHPESVNTFRVITYRWKDGIRRFPVIMRIGQGSSFLDNAHAGGMFIGVSDDGRLHKTAFTEFRKTFDEHPDTRIRYEGYPIEHFEAVPRAAERMHMAIPEIGIVNWDFTIGESGTPILIEANIASGSIWLPEIAHGCGAFGADTPEILRWLRFMKKLPASQRKRFLFGNHFE